MKKKLKSKIGKTIVFSSLLGVCVLTPIVVSTLNTTNPTMTSDVILQGNNKNLARSGARSFNIKKNNSAIKYTYNNAVLDPEGQLPDLQLMLGSFPDRENIVTNGTLFKRGYTLRIYPDNVTKKMKLDTVGYNGYPLDNPTPLPFGFEYTPDGDPEAFGEYFRFGYYNDENWNKKDDIAWKDSGGNYWYTTNEWKPEVVNNYNGAVLQGVIQLQVPGYWFRNWDDSPERNYWWAKVPPSLGGLPYKSDDDLIHARNIQDGFDAVRYRDSTYQFVDDPNSDWYVGQLSLGVYDNKFWKGSTNEDDKSKITWSLTDNISSVNKFQGTMDEFVDQLTADNLSKYVSINAFNTPSFCLDDAIINASVNQSGVLLNITTLRSFEPSLELKYDEPNRINVLKNKQWITNNSKSFSINIPASCFTGISTSTSLKAKVIDVNDDEFKNIFTNFLGKGFNIDFYHNLELVKNILITYINNNINLFFVNPTLSTKVNNLDLTITSNNKITINNVSFVGYQSNGNISTTLESKSSPWEIVNLKNPPSDSTITEMVKKVMTTKLTEDVSKDKPTIVNKDLLVAQLVSVLNELKEPGSPTNLASDTWDGLPQSYLPSGGIFTNLNIAIDKNQIVVPNKFDSSISSYAYNIPEFQIGLASIPKITIAIINPNYSLDNDQNGPSTDDSTTSTVLKAKILDVNSNEFKSIFTNFLSRGFNIDFYQNIELVKNILISYINNNINLFFNNPSLSTRVNSLDLTITSNDKIAINNVSFIGFQNDGNISTTLESKTSPWEIANLKNPPSSTLIAQTVKNVMTTKLTNDVNSDKQMITSNSTLLEELANALNSLKDPTNNWDGFPQSYLPNGNIFTSSNIAIDKTQIIVPNQFNSSISTYVYNIPEIQLGSASIPNIAIVIKNPKYSETDQNNPNTNPPSNDNSSGTNIPTTNVKEHSSTNNTLPIVLGVIGGILLLILLVILISFIARRQRRDSDWYY